MSIAVVRCIFSVFLQVEVVWAEESVHIFATCDIPALIVLFPPVINSSEILSFSLITDSGLFSVAARIQLVWGPPPGAGSTEIDFSQVWIGSRPLDEFEEPSVSEVFGNIRFLVSNCL